MPERMCVCVCDILTVNVNKFLFKIISNSMYSIGHIENGLM